MKTARAIIGGALLGAGFFFIPFILIRFLLFALLIGFVLRMFGRRGWGRWRHDFGGRNRFAFADYIRGMSDEEYNRFRQHFDQDCNPRRSFKTREQPDSSLNQ